MGIITKLSRHCLLLTFCCLLVSVNTSTAEKELNIDYDIEKEIVKVLKEIEERYEVFFTYEESLLSGLKVDFEFKENETVESAISRLLAKTGFQFNTYGERFMVIYDNTKKSKRTARKIGRKIRQIEKLEEEGGIKMELTSSNPNRKFEKVSKSIKSLTEHKIKQIYSDTLIKISGIVVDEGGEGLPGVVIQEKNSVGGIISSFDGTFEIGVKENTIVTFDFLGKQMKEILVDGSTTQFTITLIDQAELLEGVTVVAYGKQKKESVIASVTTVRPDELRTPTSNLTSALAGRLSGVISYQRSGEPGQDNAQFFIRGATTFGFNTQPLILIDGIELSTSDLSRLHPDDIASFSVMKDATATALYGARGANGVILVTTKEGVEGEVRVSARYETSVSSATQNINFADPLTYMRLHNEAVRTRDPLGFLPYSKQKIAGTEAGLNGDVYPATDWQQSLLKDQTINQRINVNLNGGGKIAQYYLSGGYVRDNGILNVDPRSDFNSNIKLNRALIRSNVNINLSKTTKAVIRMHGTFDDYRGPINGGAAMYQAIVRSNPVLFPASYTPDEANKHAQHILFGNAESGNYINPYAELLRGYKEYSEALFLTQIEIQQDLAAITKGLSFRMLGNTTRKSYFDLIRGYTPFYYNVENFNAREGIYTLGAINPNEGETTLDFQSGNKFVSSTFYTEAALQYNRTISSNHTVNGLVVGILRQFLDGNTTTLQSSLPTRNLGVSGRFTYSYSNKYFGEFNFGYNGSERFSQKERFGFFPSAGIGWYVSNERFWKPISKIVNKLKFKFTYGLVGNDNIGSSDDRFFYLSNVNLNGEGYRFGSDGTYFVPGVNITRYANDKITWETATKTNFGIELGLFESLDFQIDFFKEYRSRILMNRVEFATFGLQSQTKANLGEASSGGVDLSVDYQLNRQNFWMLFRGNFTYARGVFEKIEEPNYTDYPWLSRVGKPLTQEWGYVAERLFVDDAEVLNSPEQQIGGQVLGGDIKYKDINKDGKINDLDRVPIGYPTVPEIIYGFGASIGINRFDVSIFFQGSARSSFWIDSRATAPFIDYHFDNDPFAGKIANNALLEAYAQDHWSEDQGNVYALWPRLSPYEVPNNTTRSTWFMQNGMFLRLKSVEIGYNLPLKVLSKINSDEVRFYLSGTNLMHFSKFKIWDPEMGGNGLGYPVQRVINIGTKVSF
ncbi:SusC/RagA family TonB-linked outer membrane protein [Portibacter lacus]|uniref:SusC/RagA family TonB-linked outer membrane protein n=1 Tax=Portibacter lacus TaxID=1099794 RepID=A0AA37SRC4_9BACT|nr:TonB-dependent receptor [Portibacter lacus]GLR19283.1 SusC/RagA family TonB-linked outer membrane protein [Portibacter lacus]